MAASTHFLIFRCCTVDNWGDILEVVGTDFLELRELALIDCKSPNLDFAYLFPLTKLKKLTLSTIWYTKTTTTFRSGVLR